MNEQFHGAQKQVDKQSVVAESNHLSPRDYLCLAGAYFCFRLPWLFMLPMQYAPDEFAHFWVIKFLVEHLRLPHAAEVHAGGASAVYGSLPQLGYLPHVLIGFLFHSQYLPLVERFGSLIVGGVMLLSACWIAQILYPNDRLAQLALPSLIVCHPQLIFVQSYANNDSTSSAIASILLYLAIKNVMAGLTFYRLLWMGALFGFLLLTKYSGLAVVPAVALLILASIVIHRTSLATAFRSIFFSGLVATVICLWWFVRNAGEFAGDFMGTHTMYLSWAQTFHKEVNYYLPPSHIIKSLPWWRMAFFSFWALFGYMNLYIWRPCYFVFLAFTGASVLGWISSLRQLRLQNPRGKELIVWLALVLTVFTNIAAVIWASVYNLGGPQGRYLFTSEIAIMALLVGGLTLLGKQAEKILLGSFILFNALVSIGSFVYLFKLYGGWHPNPLI